MEIEIKYSPLRPETAAEIFENEDIFCGDEFEISMKAMYYDTPDRELKKLGCSLRFRRENSRGVCCFKRRVDALSRIEAEVQAEGIKEGIALLLERDDVPEDVKAILREKEVSALFGSKYIRRGRNARSGDSVIEAVYDSGLLFQGDRYCAVSEIELELKEGTKEDLQALGGYLASKYGLTPSQSTKAGRAAALTEEAFKDLKVFRTFFKSQYKIYRMFALGELVYRKDDSGNKTFYKTK